MMFIEPLQSTRDMMPISQSQLGAEYNVSWSWKGSLGDVIFSPKWTISAVIGNLLPNWSETIATANRALVLGNLTPA